MTLEFSIVCSKLFEVCVELVRKENKLQINHVLLLPILISV